MWGSNDKSQCILVLVALNFFSWSIRDHLFSRIGQPLAIATTSIACMNGNNHCQSKCLFSHSGNISVYFCSCNQICSNRRCCNIPNYRQHRRQRQHLRSHCIPDTMDSNNCCSKPGMCMWDMCTLDKLHHHPRNRQNYIRHCYNIHFCGIHCGSYCDTVHIEPHR